MARARVRLAVKLSAVTTLMVVATAVAAFSATNLIGEGFETLFIVLFSFLSLAIGLLFTFIIDKLITIPIRDLMQQIGIMVKADYNAPIKLSTSDEIEDLAFAVDSLRLSFINKRAKLEELNRELDCRVADRTAQLERALLDLRTAQEQLLRTEKMASIGQLAGGIAHEINNPSCIILTRVGLLMESAKEEGLNDEMLEGLEVIDRQVARISRITGDLLTFSRMSPMRQGRFDLSEIVVLTSSLIRYEAKQRSVSLDLRITPGIYVMGDRDRIEQVCINLMTNALDAMELKGGILSIDLQTKGSEVQLEVLDTGPGVAEDILGRLFDPFFTTKAVGKGTGLGLSISYGILEEHGGNISVFNRASGGAGFRVTMAVAKGKSPGLILQDEDLTTL